MLRRGLLLASFLALLAGRAGGAKDPGTSPFIVDKWEEDLPQNSVITLTQTRDGYLWLGTLGGLVRFDGLRFTVFDENNAPGLGSSRILKLFEDSRARLWIGTANAGIAVLEQGRVTSTGLGRGGTLTAACEDAAGAVWLYNSDGQLWQIRRDVTNRFVFSSNKYGVERPDARRSIIAETAGRVRVAVDGRLASFRPAEKWPAEGLPDWQEELLPQRVDTLLASPSGGFWRLSGGHIQKWSDGRLERELSVEYPWGGVAVTAACEDQQGHLIVGTQGAGVFWFDAEGRATNLSTNENLSYNFVLALHMDREGNLWVGTDGGGLNRVKRRTFSVLEPTRGKVVQSVSEAPDGALWVGFNVISPDARGVMRWQDGTNQMYGGPEGLLHQTVRSVLVQRDGQVWVGTAAGFFRRQLEKFQQVFGLNVSQPSVHALHESRAGQIWVGTSRGAWRLNGAAWSTFDQRASLSAVPFRALADDADGNLWLGTEANGLHRLSDGTLTAIRKSPDGLPSDNISALCADADGILWVGTEGGGLARLKAGRWTRFTTREGLVSNSIGYLLDDGLGYLWLGSSAGLMRVAKRDLNDFAEGRSASLNGRAYGRDEGLPTRECSRGSQPGAWRGRDGRLWFTTIKGLASVDPARLQPNTNPPPVVIEAVRYDGQAGDPGHLMGASPGQVTIPPRRQRVEVQFTSLNLGAPRQARFKYRLEGQEAGWTDAGERGQSREVVFRQLSPGRHVFQVTACNEDGVWNLAPAAVVIDVLPPFWRTWWFLSAVVVATLGSVVALVHFISTQNLNRQLATMRQQEALERERARIARDIHDQLGANLTQVALLGELVEADKNSPTDIEDHARQISQTARDTTRSLDEIVWTVNPANDTLEGMASYLCKYAQDYLAVAGVGCRLEIPAQLPAAAITPEVRHNVFLAAREAITNVVRHAQASSAWLRLKLEPGKFIFEIEDNGRGPGGTESERARTRNGLRNMSKRMEDVGGSFHIGPGAERGTVVRLTAPLRSR